MNITKRQEAKPTTAPTQPTEWSPWGMLRDLMRWDPFREMSPYWPSMPQRDVFMPDVDVKETPEAYIFKADLPGVAENDIEVSLTGNRLTLSGKREEEKKEEKENYYSLERFYGSFSRSFTLPSGTNPDATVANLKDGVLTITVPKKPEVQPKRVAVQGTEKKT